MVMTRETVAHKLAAWAEFAMMEGEFEDAHHGAIRDAVARLGRADVRAFGLTWEDCGTILKQLGYDLQANIIAI
jgi:hypothetical protein